MSKPQSVSGDSRTNSVEDTDQSYASVTEVIRGKSLNHVIAESGEQTTERKVALFWADMRSRWANSQPVSADEYVEAIDDPAGTGSDAVVDLIYSEFALRQEFGRQIPFDDYCRRFPRHSAALQRQIVLHDGLRDTGIPLPLSDAGEDASQNTDPDSIGKYAVVAKIGDGGQCAVYRAVHPQLGTEVAIKLGRPLLSDDRTHMDAIRKEGQLLSELKHPNLAQVFDLDFDCDRPFLVLEYVRGPNLRQRLRQSPLSSQQSATLIAGVAKALSCVHHHGMLHLDVKPSNIAIDSEGTPRLIDFGLSRRFDAWSEIDSDSQLGISGTVRFMSPEQAAGDSLEIDQRSDTFSLGATLYFLLVGKPPYAGRDLGSMVLQAQRCEWDRDALEAPGVPKPLQRICRKAMAERPSDRYATMDEFAEELESFAVAPRWSSLHRTAIVTIVLILIAITGWSLGWFARRDAADQVTLTFPAISPLVSAPRVSLTVRVFDPDGSYRLADVAPMENGDELQIRATIPSALHASLLLFTSDGQLKELHRVAPSDTPQTLAWPTDAGQAVALEGSAGTEFLFVCADSEQPVSVSSVESLWGDPGAWPSIPDLLVLRLGPDGVVIEQRDRDLSPPSNLPRPAAVVMERLEVLHKRLSKRFATFEGIVFAHRE